MNALFPTISLLLAAGLWAGSLPAADPDQACADCHGKEGASTESDVPTIGGLSEQYLLDSMAAYRDKKRPCPESKYRAGDTKRAKTDMCRIAAALGEADTAAVARELGGHRFVRAKQPFDAAKAAAGKKIHDLNCEKCHSEGGSSAADDAGILAGQWAPYLKASFDEFSRGLRPQPTKMKPKTDALKPADIEALIQYYASQQ